MSEKQPIIDSFIRSAWHRLSRMYNQKASEHQITMSIGFILLHVDKHGTPSTQLGPRMGMEPTSLSRTLKTMEERNLIKRVSESNDKRKVLIFLTNEGVSMRKEVKNFLYDFNEKINKHIDSNMLETFFKVIQQIEDVVELELKETKNKLNE